MKIYELERGDVFSIEGVDVPLRYHGMDGMYARCSVASEGFRELHEAFEARRVAFISCGANVEKLETSEQSEEPHNAIP